VNLFASFESKLGRGGMNSVDYGQSDRQIQETVKLLGLSDESKRRQARRELEIAGKKAVPILIEALFHGNSIARREAAEVLVTIKDAATAPALVCTLEDEDHDARWAASKALIALDQEGLEPLLLALMVDFTSVHLREGTRHVLKTLKNASCLENPLLEVLKALEGLQPTATVPWAAEKAWEELYGPGKKVKKSK
jgi:HEAT repeat protein